MNKIEQKKISKRLSYVLRHDPASIGVELDDAGWIGVDTLLSALGVAGRRVTHEKLSIVVADSDKQRFEFSEDRTRIRARQGHSVEVDLGYKPAVPPDVLFHGTARHNVESINDTGLSKGKRHHVHMSTDKQTMLDVGGRHGKPILVSIDAKAMHEAGHEFFVTGNNVWLTEHVPPEFLSILD